MEACLLSDNRRVPQYPFSRHASRTMLNPQNKKNIIWYCKIMATLQQRHRKESSNSSNCLFGWDDIFSHILWWLVLPAVDDKRLLDGIALPERNDNIWRRTIVSPHLPRYIWCCGGKGWNYICATGSVLKLIAFPGQEAEANCTQCTVDEDFDEAVRLILSKLTPKLLSYNSA